MKSRWLFAGSILAVVALSLTVYAQVQRPYRDGGVWSITFIRVKPGMEEGYKTYLSGQWKMMNEAMKKEGMILSYKVIETEAHSPGDWNVMLMSEFKDLATMEANEAKTDSLAQKLLGDDQKQMQGYEDRTKFREIIGERLAREIVFEPRQ